MKMIRLLLLLLTALITLPITANPARAAGSVPVRWCAFSENPPNRWSATVVYPEFTPQTQIVRQANTILRDNAAKRFQTFLQKARRVSGEFVSRYQLRIIPTVGVGRPELVSVWFLDFEDNGGAHPMTVLRAISVGQVNGHAKRLLLSDLLAQNAAPDDLVEPVLRTLNTQRAARTLAPLTRLDPGLLENFVLTPTGIAWLFSPYSVGPYVEGMFTVKIPYADLLSSLDPDGPLKPVLGS